MDAALVDEPVPDATGSKPSRGWSNPEDGRCRGRGGPGLSGPVARESVV